MAASRARADRPARGRGGHLAVLLADARRRSDSGTGYPAFVGHEFHRYLDCGVLAHGFARLRCPDCGFERLVAFSCKGRLWPSCWARRAADTAANLVVDAVSDLLKMETIDPSDIDRCGSLLAPFFESRGMEVSTTKSLEVAFSGVAGCLGRLEPRRSARWREFTRLNDDGALDPQDPNHLALVEALANESRDPEGQNVVLECFAVKCAKASA